MTEPTIDTLKANILTEFKQVLKLAPADYTENCTNVVMSLVDEYIADQVAKARIDELIGVRGWTEYEPDPKYSPAERFHIVPYTYLTNRIAELKGVKNK